MTKAAKQTFSDIFDSRGYMVMSEAAARVLRQFNLGNGALYPVRVTLADQETPIGEGWYCLNYGNARESVMREHLAGLMPIPDTDLYILGGYLKDGQLAVRRSALGGPHVWVDPRLLRGFFVSGRLGAAIKQAKLTGFYLLSAE